MKRKVNSSTVSVSKRRRVHGELNVKQSLTLPYLPTEVWALIVAHCAYSDFQNVSQTSTQMRALCTTPEILYTVLVERIFRLKTLHRFIPLAQVLETQVWLYDRERLLFFGRFCKKPSFSVCGYCGYFPFIGDTHVRMINQKICSQCVIHPDVVLLTASEIKRRYRFDVSERQLVPMHMKEAPVNYASLPSSALYTVHEVSRGISATYGSWDGFYTSEEERQERKIALERRNDVLVTQRQAKRDTRRNKVVEEWTAFLPTSTFFSTHLDAATSQLKGLVDLVNDRYIQSRWPALVHIKHMWRCLDVLGVNETTYIDDTRLPHYARQLTTMVEPDEGWVVYLQRKIECDYRIGLIRQATSLMGSFYRVVMYDVSCPFVKSGEYSPLPPWLPETSLTLTYSRAPTPQEIKRFADGWVYNRLCIWLETDRDLKGRDGELEDMLACLNSTLFSSCTAVWKEFRERVTCALHHQKAEWQRHVRSDFIMRVREQMTLPYSIASAVSVEMDFINDAVWPERPPWCPSTNFQIDYKTPATLNEMKLFEEGWVFVALSDMADHHRLPMDVATLRKVDDLLTGPLFYNSSDDWTITKMAIQLALTEAEADIDRQVVAGSIIACICGDGASLECDHYLCETCCSTHSSMTICDYHWNM